MHAQFSANDLAHALQVLEQGGTVAFGTDTVWGIGADPRVEDAVLRLYGQKGRPGEKALQVLCHSQEQAQTWVRPDFASSTTWKRLCGLWPAALTLVVPAHADCPGWLTRDGKVGLRVPGSSDARYLLEAVGMLAASSLNRSGEPPITSYPAAVSAELADFVLPGAPTSGEASTVYDALTHKVLRIGSVSLRQIEDTLCMT
ncbi:L-threonylcarbamoyladenylate synthase [Deinococcus peraridilitoris]|uniref:L-threonylcarbamoyladenylate synthase n=1 Tax=Deinococcus peraridilitoris (strain DSM 19664 / LMG 22246 / CIP 109416 / KR-200) TaxID=937777 RepID=L0A6N7_DEIPD|nr:L-threonylcarbamoyladenylate synthase [Deinococcus peraridilitoris]AFZ68852.1 putative translation factor (SUA5) [Deinococcus peraridilitoris DSM 19664]